VTSPRTPENKNSKVAGFVLVFFALFLFQQSPSSPRLREGVKNPDTASGSFTLLNKNWGPFRYAATDFDFIGVRM
jgi:hypothetical protein